MSTILEELYKRQDTEYGDFQAKLTPGIPRENIIGVRVPVLRALAKEVKKTPEAEEFLDTLPHATYDENMFHGILLSESKDFDACLRRVEHFLPYVDNWAVCDIMSPKCFRKHKDVLITKIRSWCESEQTYTCRFGMEMLMTHFLDEDFRPEYLEISAAVRSEEYYVNMMIAWFFATALAKQWESTIGYLQEERLSVWTHNKTIQKAIESYRITAEQKEYLRTLRRKKV